MKIVIVDDEQHCIDSLVHLLEKFSGKISSVTSFREADAAIKGIETLQPDILFLDVQLKDQTGFDILRKLSYRDFSLIFSTAYEQYAIEAIRFSAIDYLLKPVAAAELEAAMQKAMLQVEKEALSGKVNVLLSHVLAGQKPKRISVPTTDGYIFLEVSDIIRCQADINYTVIYHTSGHKYVVSRTLKYFEDLLCNHDFFRVHHSHLINLHHMLKYTRTQGGFVTMSDQSTIEVSNRRKDEFLRLCAGKGS